MRIKRLIDHPDAISVLASWYVSEWEPYYGKAEPGDARADLVARLNREALPIGLVAMEGERVLASAALGLDVTTSLTPSIIGLLVGRNHWGQGIGTAIIASCEDLARELGYRHLYMSTSDLERLLQRLGWWKTGEIRFLNEEHGSVFVRDL